MKKNYHIISLIALFTALQVATAKGAAAQADPGSLVQAVRECDEKIKRNFEKRYHETGQSTRILKELVCKALVSVVVHKKQYPMQLPEILLPNPNAQRAVDRIKEDVIKIDLFLKDPVQLHSFGSLDEEENSLAEDKRNVFDKTKKSIVRSYTIPSMLEDFLPAPKELRVIVRDYEGNAESIMKESFLLPLTSHFHLCTLIAQLNDNIQQEEQDRRLAQQLHDQLIAEIALQKKQQEEKDSEMAARLQKKDGLRGLKKQGKGLRLLFDSNWESK
jgi:hypothetical protein